MLADDIEKFTKNTPDGNIDGIKIPIEITNNTKEEHQIAEFVVNGILYNAQGEKLENLADYDPYVGDTIYDMKYNSIAPGETVTTHILASEDPSGEYQLVVSGALTRVIKFHVD